MLKSVTLEIVGDRKMACEGCEERVQDVLGQMQGVRKVRAQARKQCVEVLFDPAQVEQTAIAERLKEAGYDSKAAGS